MRKIFSKSFYIDTLYRLRAFIVFSLVYFTVGASFTPASLILQLVNDTPITDFLQQTLLQPSQIIGLAPFSVIFVPIMTVMAFSFLFKRNSADFYEHLPYTRLQMSVSALLAVMTAAVATITIASLIPTLLLIPSVNAGIIRYSFAAGIPLAIGELIAAFYAMAAAFVGVSVAGTFIGAALATLSIILLPRFIMTMTTVLLEALSPTLVEGHSIPLFNNSYNLATTLIIDKTSVLTSPVPYIYTFILGAAILALGIYLYRRRTSESATRTFASYIALEIIRTAIATSLSLCAIALFFAGIWAVAIALLGVATLIHFAFGRSCARERGARRRAFITLGIGVGAAVIIFLSTLIGSVAVNSYSPDTDEISHVSLARELAMGQRYVNYPDYIDLRVSDIEIDNLEVRELVAKALERGVPKNYFDHNPVPVKIKSGLFSRYRMLYLTDDEKASINAIYAEREDYKKLWLEVGVGAYNPYVYINGEELDADKTAAILESYKDEVKAMGFDAYSALYQGSWSDYTICYSVIYDGEEIIINLPIFEQLSKTYTITQNCAKEIEARRYNELIELLDGISTSDEVYYLSMDYYGSDEYYYAYCEIGAGGDDTDEVVSKIKSFITPKLSYNKDMALYISIWTDDLTDYGISGSFLIKDDVSEDEIIDFLKKYEQ